MDKYSLEVQKAISHAETVAFKFSHSLIGSEHLLLGVLKTDNIVSKELKNYHITYDAIAKKVKELYPQHENSPLYMEYTLELRNVLDRATALSKQYHEETTSIAVLGISLLISENTMAYEILKKMKVDFRLIQQTLQSKIQRKSELNSITDLHYLGDKKKDPLIGREKELNQLICALTRRNKPNAILVGEPGVGKTAIIEELAYLLKENKIPSLKEKSIYELDLASTVGGTKYRGEFEDKIKKILKKVIDDGNCILFIDEIHNLIRAGGAEGAIDASNILKPYLSRGEIQLIGATTEDEFQNVFEKDKALKRRFQIIKVAPNTVEETKLILRKIKPLYEKHYNLKIEDALLDYIVEVSDRHLPNLSFPDKAIDILDSSCVFSSEKLEKEKIDYTFELTYKIKVNPFNRKEIALQRITEELVGQELVKDKIELHLNSLEHHIYDQNKPMLSLLFLGPSGVGKTKLARIIGETYFDKDSIIYLDMSSYQESNAILKLTGYGNEQNPKLIRDLKAHPKSLILLDEIEKANNEVLDFFLSILDQGYFDTNKGEKIDCKSTIIIFTSNYGYDSDYFFHLNMKNEIQNEKKILQKLQNRFRYEFLSRLDDIILFDYLDENARNEIARKTLNEYHLETEFASMDEILVHSREDYQKYGARMIQKDVKRALVDRLSQKKVSN